MITITIFIIIYISICFYFLISLRTDRNNNLNNVVLLPGGYKLPVPKPLSMAAERARIDGRNSGSGQMSIDRSKPSEVTVTINGQVYNTTVYPEIPELPEGYRVFQKKLLRHNNLSGVTWPETRIADIDAEGRLWARLPIEPEEIPALIAFLQGAR